MLGDALENASMSRGKKGVGMLIREILLILVCSIGVLGNASGQKVEHRLPWTKHTLSRVSQGADGVRLGDVNKDGRLDIATGWEEGGRITVAIQPESDVQKQWPFVTVGRVKSPEDAFPVDVNGDGWPDIVSCCEGSQRAVFLHLNPGSPESVCNSETWVTYPIESTVGQSRWMFGVPLNGARCVLGSKEPHGQIALVELGGRTAALRKLRSAGWIMSLRAIDMDGDQDLDVLYSDRKGNRRGVGWLEQTSNEHWVDHVIGGADVEAMFLDVSEVDGSRIVACNTRNGFVLLLRREQKTSGQWLSRRISHPQNSGAGKAVAISDVNLDGVSDLVCTCGLAAGKLGVYWLDGRAQWGNWPRAGETSEIESWPSTSISGLEIGTKFDRIEMLDIDGDGDVDLLTCEERENLGVIWYENPAL